MQTFERFLVTPIETLTVQERDGKSRKVLRGLAAVYHDGSPGTEYRLQGNLFERFAPGVFEEALERADDIPLTINHDPKQVLAWKNTGRLKLSTSSRGLHYEAALTNTQRANDTFEDVLAGNYKGSSFRFAVDYSDRKSVTFIKEKDKEIALIKRIARLEDVSVVTVPAYSAASVEAAMRGLDKWNETEARIARMAQLQDEIKNHIPWNR